MKILLIAIPVVDLFEGRFLQIGMDYRKQNPPTGLYSLATIINLNGYKVEIADLIANGIDSFIKYLNRIEEFDLIGLGATSFSWPTAIYCINEIRKKTNKIPIVLGGIHPTMFDYYILSKGKVNFIIRGEAETAILKLLEYLRGQRQIESVNNLTYINHAGKIIRNQIDKLIDINEVPPPDYSVLPTNLYLSLSIESSRGCPFNCIFCSTMYRKTYRALRPLRFVNNLEYVQSFLGKTINKTIYIIDDEFTINKNRVTRIMYEIEKRKLNVKLRFDARIPDINNLKMIESVIPFLDRFLIGAECGYDDGLEKIGKKINIKQIEESARILHSYDISHLCDFSFVIGFPWEKYDDVIKTIEFASKLFVKYNINVYLQYYMQLPGSILWEEQRKNGVLSEALYDNFGLFNNPYIFRTGVNFKIEEFETISEIVAAIRIAYKLGGLHDYNDIYYSHPLVLRNYFNTVHKTYQDKTGFHSLVECSHGKLKP